MKISYNWLKDFIEIPLPPEQIAAKLTQSGLEVEKVEYYESLKGGLSGLVVGEVITCEKHPNADKLSKTTVKINKDSIVPIVCGAPNVAVGQKVIVATVGSTLYPKDAEAFKISKAKIRGEVSEGMICAENEIGLGKSHEGIIVLKENYEPGTPASEVFKIENDYIFEIGLTPNRADAASHLGVARDLKALLGNEVTIKSYGLPKSSGAKPVTVKIENPQACPRYTGLTIQNVTVSESPDWLKKRLLSIGLNPINNIVDITNYILHDLGQPLHAFDLDVTGNTILIKNLPDQTEFTTLDNVKHKLSKDDLMICNEKEGLCIAGVFGGKESGVSNQTKNIFLESAYFTPESVRKTSLRHGIKTDSSFRFERGTDPNMPLYALQKAASLICEITGGTIASDIIDLYPKPVENFIIETSYDYIKKLIGKNIENGIIKNILQSLDIHIIKETSGAITLSVPPYRVDVQREADIVEEVIRIYGYDNIELSQTVGTSFIAEAVKPDKDQINKTIANLLADNGFYEIITNSLTKPQYREYLGIQEEPVVILNKLSEELGVLRQSLLFSGLEILAYNINRKQKDLKLFEIGKVYSKSEKGYSEQYKAALFLSGSKNQESWMNKGESVDFYFQKNIIEKLFGKLNFKDIRYEAVTSNIIPNGLIGYKNNSPVIQFGELASQLTKKADIKQSVYYAEIDLSYIYKKHQTELIYEEIPKFPEVRRDLSLVIDQRVTFEEIKVLAFKTEKKLLTQVNVFDIYEGDKIEKGKKAYSVSFTLQDFENTLTDKQIDKTMQGLMTCFEKELQAVIRK